MYVDPEVLHEDQFVAVGEHVTIKCHASNFKTVIWEYRSGVQPNVHGTIFDRRLTSGYQHGFTVDKSTYELTILEAKLDNTGEYRCIEHDGYFTNHITKLYVTGTRTM